MEKKWAYSIKRTTKFYNLQFLLQIKTEIDSIKAKKTLHAIYSRVFSVNDMHLDHKWAATFCITRWVTECKRSSLGSNDSLMRFFCLHRFLCVVSLFFHLNHSSTHDKWDKINVHGLICVFVWVFMLIVVKAVVCYDYFFVCVFDSVLKMKNTLTINVEKKRA